MGRGGGVKVLGRAGAGWQGLGGWGGGVGEVAGGGCVGGGSWAGCGGVGEVGRLGGYLLEALRRPRRSNRVGHIRIESAALATRMAHVAFQTQGCWPEVLRRPRGSDYVDLRPLTAANGR